MDYTNSNSLTERQLVEKVLGGDTQAFSGIIGRTERLVAHIVCKMISHAEDRKDLVQDIYIKVFQHLPGFRFQSQLSTWVAQIAYHTCINFLEKKKVLIYNDWRPEPDDASDGHNDDRLPATAYQETAFPLLKKERGAIINQAIAQLSPIFRLLVSLYHQEELSYNEIGQITGLPEGTIKSYLYRARQSLREQLLRDFKKDEL